MPKRHADGFAQHLLTTGVAEYRAQPGCLDVRLLRHDEKDWAVFELTSLWTDMAAVVGYAGDDPDAAVLYTGDEAFELIPNLTVSHLQVVETQ